VLEHFLSVSDEVFGVEHRQLDIVLAKKFQQQLFALNLRKFAEIAIPPKEIEGIVDEPAGPAGPRLTLLGVRRSWYLHDCSDCFRLERLPGGIFTHWKAPPLHGARQQRT
jgi:hypothetical protein